MVVMWMLMILVWRMLSKVLHRFGRWALVVPVAAMGAAVFGLNVWTAATVLLALLLAVLLALVLVGWRQAGTSGLLPVTANFSTATPVYPGGIGLFVSAPSP
jgi:hypothetical protein